MLDYTKLRPAGQIRPAKAFHPAREAVLSIIKNIFRKNLLILQIWHIPKQPLYVRCPALELLCNRLCCPLAKKFGDPWTIPNLMLKKIHSTDAELAGHTHKLDVKQQKLCGSGFSSFAVRMLAKPYQHWSELTNDNLRKQRWVHFFPLFWEPQ